MSLPGPGPLDQVRSIKVKLGVLVGLSVFVAVVLGTVADTGGVAPWLAIPVAVAVALGITQLLATGMTSPLREMTLAASRMARGDYSVRVTTSSRDEVGRLAAAFNTMARDLAAVDQERRDLVATVSHELRTPLTALSVRLENLADGVEEADPGTFAELLERTRRLGSLVADLLDLSRIEAGSRRLTLGQVEVRSLIDGVVGEQAPTSRPVEYDVSVAEGLHVTADAARLRQVLANVLENAARHSPAGGRVTVSATPVPGGRWVLEVSDEGPGIPSEQRERVFERFGTLAGHEGGGTGLGLAISRWITELHGGSVRFVDPASDREGARLRVELPLDPTARLSAPTPPGPAGVPAVASPTSPTRTPAPVTIPAGVEPPLPPMDALFGRIWPEDDVPARRTLLVAAAAVGVLAAVVLPYRRLGLGTFLVVACAGVVVAFASRHRKDPFTVACAALSAVLTCPLLLRDAAWIDTMCVLAGAAVMTIGACRGRSIPGFVISGLAWPLAGLRGLPWLGRSSRSLVGPGRAPAVARTILVSVLLLTVFGVLFASADALFAHWLDAVLPDWTVTGFVNRAFLATGVAAVVLAAAYVALNPPRVEPDTPPVPRAVSHRYEWLVPVLLLDAVFALFLLAQAAAVFGGHAYLRRTTGLTYAEYVHQGFGQLTTATALTLLVVWAAARKAPRVTPGDRLWLRASLGALCLMTLVVVASALYRVHVYQEAYGYTRLRLLVDVFEGWLGVLVVGAMIAGWRLRGPWLPRVALLTGAAALAGLALLNPDAWIARHNLERYEATGRIDWFYLQGLSADAAVAVQGLEPDVQACVVGQTYRHWDRLEWNLGLARARSILADLPEDRVGDNCPDPVRLRTGD